MKSKSTEEFKDLFQNIAVIVAMSIGYLALLSAIFSIKEIF